MSAYTLPHSLMGERTRLELMSELLDPFHKRVLERLGVQPGWRCLEVGCGNGSISQWLAARVAPNGLAVASDVDITYVRDLHVPGLEVRQLNILEDPVEEAAYDLVTARAVLHHLPAREKATRRMISALKLGGMLLSIEPDFLPATVAEPESLRSFWQAWLQWSVSVGIDYFIGRKMPSLLSRFGLKSVSGEGSTAMYNGGSSWATYWLETLAELRPKLLESGYLTDDLLAAVQNAYSDPQVWTSAITFVASWGHRPV